MQNPKDGKSEIRNAAKAKTRNGREAAAGKTLPRSGRTDRAQVTYLANAEPEDAGWIVADQAAPYFDLEDRTFEFAQRVRRLVKRLTMTLANVEDARQLIRSSGSVGANYIEANESLGRKDFLMHIRICRKEAKESRFWLRLLDLAPTPLREGERGLLVAEAVELTKIFGAIYRKSDRREE